MLKSILLFLFVDFDPNNKGFLTYDEFYKNISKTIKITHPECYVVYKQAIDQSRSLLSMKILFKLLGGAWFL